MQRVSLFFNLVQKFSHSKTKVLLVRDLPPLGFAGEIVQVQPGYATNELIPDKKAVYNIQGLRERLFPNYSEELIAARKAQLKELNTFESKTKNMMIEFIRTPSFSNPNLVKQEINLKDIIREVQLKYQLAIPLNIVTVSVQEFNKFGVYQIEVTDFEHVVLNQKFSFEFNVVIKKPAPKPVEKEQAQAKDGATDKQKSEGQTKTISEDQKTDDKQEKPDQKSGNQAEQKKATTAQTATTPSSKNQATQIVEKSQDAEPKADQPATESNTTPKQQKQKSKQQAEPKPQAQ